MKIKNIGFPNGHFYFDTANMTKTKVEIIAVGYKNTDKKIKISINGIKHFRVTDESYFIDTFMDLISNHEDKSLLYENGGQGFFEIIDERYSDWVLKESYHPLNREYFKQYIFLFEESVVEIISSEKPTYTFVDN